MSFLAQSTTPQPGSGAVPPSLQFGMTMVVLGILVGILILLMIWTMARWSVGRTAANHHQRRTGAESSGGEVSPWQVAGQRATPEPAKGPSPKTRRELDDLANDMSDGGGGGGGGGDD